MAGRRLAAHPKKALQRRAYLILLDESGLLMAPLLRRSWALRGHPPQQEQKVGHREKVSVAAALWLTPAGRHLRLAYRTLVNGYFNNGEVAEFLRGAVEGLSRPLIVVWDGGSMHQGDPIRALVAQSRGRLEIERLPASAPELMPVEPLWRWLKYDRLCNFGARDAQQLNEVVIREMEAIRDNQPLLWRLFHLSALPWTRTLLP